DSVDTWNERRTCGGDLGRHRLDDLADATELRADHAADYPPSCGRPAQRAEYPRGPTSPLRIFFQRILPTSGTPGRARAARGHHPGAAAARPRCGPRPRAT